MTCVTCDRFTTSLRRSLACCSAAASPIRRRPRRSASRRCRTVGARSAVAGRCVRQRRAPCRTTGCATFNDPQLDALVHEAIANNPDLRVAGARVEQAAQYLVVAQAALRPWVGVFGTGGAKTGGGGDSSSALQALMLAASWELDLWGRLRYARNAAEQDLVSAQADYEFARQSLAASTAKAWFTATQLTLNAATRRRHGAIREPAHQPRRRIVSASVRAPTPTRPSRARTRRTWRTRMQQARARARPGAACARAAGRPLSRGRSERPRRAARAAAAHRRRDAAADAGAAARCDRRRTPRGRRVQPRRPSEGRAAAADHAEREFRRLRERDPRAARRISRIRPAALGARLLAPIYQGGALKAQVEIRTLQQKEAVADYARVALRALGDVENALAASASLATRAALLADALSEQTRALELTRDRDSASGAPTGVPSSSSDSARRTRASPCSTCARTSSRGRVNLHLALGGSFAPAAAP